MGLTAPSWPSQTLACPQGGTNLAQPKHRFTQPRDPLKINLQQQEQTQTKHSTSSSSWVPSLEQANNPFSFPSDSATFHLSLKASWKQLPPSSLSLSTEGAHPAHSRVPPGELVLLPAAPASLCCPSARAQSKYEPRGHVSRFPAPARSLPTQAASQEPLSTQSQCGVGAGDSPASRPSEQP